MKIRFIIVLLDFDRTIISIPITTVKNYTDNEQCRHQILLVRGASSVFEGIILIFDTVDIYLWALLSLFIIIVIINYSYL